MKEFYALIITGTNTFYATANSKDELNKRINRAYKSSYAMRAKGTEYTMDDFMENKEIIKVTFEPV